MESSAYTDRTLDTFEQKLFPGHENNVGVVLQSSLRRTLDDVGRTARNPVADDVFRRTALD
jgi:proline dehydrogenase